MDYEITDDENEQWKKEHASCIPMLQLRPDRLPDNWRERGVCPECRERIVAGIAGDRDAVWYALKQLDPDQDKDA